MSSKRTKRARVQKEKKEEELITLVCFCFNKKKYKKAEVRVIKGLTPRVMNAIDVFCESPHNKFFFAMLHFINPNFTLEKLGNSDSSDSSTVVDRQNMSAIREMIDDEAVFADLMSTPPTSNEIISFLDFNEREYDNVKIRLFY